MAKLSGREWRRIHAENWKTCTRPEKGNLSKLQKECLKALLEKELLDSYEEVRENNVEENIILANLKRSNARFRIYDGDAELEGVDEFFHVEECGCLTPQEFVDYVVEKSIEYTKT